MCVERVGEKRKGKKGCKKGRIRKNKGIKGKIGKKKGEKERIRENRRKMVLGHQISSFFKFLF